jgi:hypothetical protein
MFTFLASEVESISSAYGYTTSEALEFIKTHIEEYSESSELLYEIELFSKYGYSML